MAKEQEVAVIHLEGEQELVVVGVPNQGSTVDTYGGRIHVKWDETAAVTPFGQLAFFIEFLKTAGLWDGWIKECPVTYTTNPGSRFLPRRFFSCRLGDQLVDGGVTRREDRVEDQAAVFGDLITMRMGKFLNQPMSAQ